MWIFWSPSDLLLFGICTISFPFWLCLRNTFGVPKKDFRLAPKSWHRCVQFHVYSHKLYKSHTLHLQAHVSQTHVRSQRLLSGVQKNAQHNRIDLYINLYTVWCDEVTIRQCTAKKVKPVSLVTFIVMKLCILMCLQVVGYMRVYKMVGWTDKWGGIL